MWGQTLHPLLWARGGELPGQQPLHSPWEVPTLEGITEPPFVHKGQRQPTCPQRGAMSSVGANHLHSIQEHPREEDDPRVRGKDGGSFHRVPSFLSDSTLIYDLFSLPQKKTKCIKHLNMHI